MKKKKRSWNKNFTGISMACWNPWGISNERFNYCMAMNHDVLGLTELHNVHNKKLWRGKRWVTSADAKIDELTGNSTDSASGVGILLSRRFAKLVLAKGHIGSRIVWVRLKGPVCPLLVVLVYVPHKYRKSTPRASDTLAQIDKLLSDSEIIKPNDCIVLMGDFNCELQRNVKGCTGRWLMNQRPDDGHSNQVLDLLRSHDLFAVDSMFRPKRKTIGQGGKPRVCNATYLQKDASRRPKKLDYIFVSNRWKSSVTNSTTNWATAIHRFGKFFDHCLLQLLGNGV